jgi:hypothetical protein
LNAGLAVGGLVLGKLLLSWWQVRHGQHPMSRVDYANAIGWYRYVIAAFGNLPAALYSTFSVAWPLVTIAFVEQWTARRRVAWAMIGAVLLAGGATLVALDTTRVFALISWPLVLFAVTRVPKIGLAVWCLLVGLVVPRIIVWDGGIIASGFHRLLVNLFSAA